ncbi:class I SAM-dependent methyltransferase [Paenibacillus sp.]|uniref:SAM-dependent methyltransferase n=1 Tax=Paenibacillus sp. TaxID=58172 RepID=UPI002D7285DA|nr:class I SAM-dependent methyltransferase [Paenibacillus sp.]HZG57918.1 class I SAM-dependent methyltransferase [Paenibacillus sp.]
MSGEGASWIGAAAAGLMLLAALSIVAASWRNGISPMPASAPVRRVVAAEVARFGRAGRVAEAGAGWGTLALAIARRNPGWTVTGIENSPVPWLSSVALARAAGLTGRVRFLRGDLFKFPYEEADLVVCYLYPGAMARLSGVLRRRLAPGARAISVCFAMPGWTPERVLTCSDAYATKVYIYTADG